MKSIRNVNLAKSKLHLASNFELQNLAIFESNCQYLSKKNDIINTSQYILINY
jgi:hypothetical protein